ncbi:PDZ/DHR/GLGF domain protein [Spirochaeta thermophila DSM 6578]|uniref:PDZ/DHR/GLGF domain protein n=1 Tax=Winmispira thermophila (strain ATCC 700085 / DSM 6578 / Z-1203) TaxID=869211 RepID=G0GDJ7_WINT7|nr:trypsin-like peptidase domain-containing protein [Spirochaeta thermophila]AEJ61344.1 PDZ/DHR/GLGF domain protein [Spirochaeta thermophila DSM 6578]
MGNEHLKGILLWISLSVFVFSSCVTESGRAQETIPPVEEVTISMLESLLDDGKPERVLTLLSLMEAGGGAALSDDDRVHLRERALQMMKAGFSEAIEEKEFGKARELFVSLTTLGVELPEWSRGRLFFEEAEVLREEHCWVPALMMLYRAVEEGYSPPREALEPYISQAKKWKYSYWLSKVSPDGGESLSPSSDLLTRYVGGVVTIWVDRGISIRQGVGVPDRAIGSGFFIDDRGHLLTNYHVIHSEVDPSYEGYSRVFVRLPSRPEEKIPAKVLAYDTVFDLALLKTEVDVPVVLPLSLREGFSPGEKLFAVGSPGGLQSTLTSGIISALHRPFLELGDVLQVDVPVNPGNSGGPLLDERGEVVGVIFAGVEDFEGINFAIPGYWFPLIIPRLYGGGRVMYPWLGLSLYEGESGIEVVEVIPGGPLDGFPLSPGDVITSIDGRRVHTLREAQRVLLDLGPGTLVSLDYLHEDKPGRIITALGERPERVAEWILNRAPRPVVFSVLFGMRVEKVGGGLPWEENYRVVRVYPGSIADEASISVNDPFTLKKWVVNREDEYLAVQLYIKKRTSGFLDAYLQLAASFSLSNIL